MSPEAFQTAYPQRKIPKSSKDYGKVFVCRLGCNTRTATYTDEFVWEDVYQGAEDIHKLTTLVKNGTKAARKQRSTRMESPDILYEQGNDDEEWKQKRPTPKKAGSVPGTPKKPKTNNKPVTPSSHRK